MVRCLRGPYFRRIQNSRCTPSPSRSYPATKPSCARMSSTAFESLDVGATSSSLYAVLALRILVNRSATGSDTFDENFVFFGVLAGVVVVTMRPWSPPEAHPDVPARGSRSGTGGTA